MVHKVRNWWEDLERFDKLGTGLVSWEALSLVVGIVLLPLLRQGAVPLSLVVLLVANLVAMSVALLAWFVVHLAITGGSTETPGESLQRFVERRVHASRERHLRRAVRRP